MVNYTGTSLYGDYNPYSATNLQGGYNSASGLMSQTTPFERVILEAQGNGQDYSNVTADGYSPNSYGLAGNEGGALGQTRATNALSPSMGTIAKAGLGLATGESLSPMSALSSIPQAGYAAAGFEKPEGFWGGLASKVPGVVGSLALGPVGGLMGSMVGTPFADMVGDAFDSREYENIRDESEDKFGQIGGRRAFADLKDSVTNQEMLGAANLQSAIDSMSARAAMQQVGTPEQMASYQKDLANLQAYQNSVAQQRPTHNWGIDPAGGMSAQMQANLADKYGVGWSRDAHGNIQSTNGIQTGFGSDGNMSWGGSSGYSSRDNGGGGNSNNNSENNGAGGQTGGDKDGGRY